jgi:CelD/BcsL family acetyltransferase involved in cellulose biosynthesis
MQPTLSNHRSSDEAIAAFAPSDAMQVRVLRSWADLASIKDHWAAMLERSENASIFCSYEWMESWWNAWGESGHLNVLVFEVNGQMFALAPLYIESRKVTGATLEYLSMVGDNSGDSENLDFIVTPGYERECAEAFLRWLEQNPSVDICSFKAMPESSTFGEALLGLLKQREWAVEQWTSPGFYIPLPATFDEYLSRLSSEMRPLLTRYPRRLEKRFAVKYVQVTDEKDLPKYLDALFSLHQKRWEKAGEPGAFSEQARREFYVALSVALLRRGWLDLWAAELNGQIAAVQYCFHFGNIVSLLQEGFDPQFESEKVGYALRAKMLQDFIDRKFAKYDFLGGADAYKERFGGLPQTYENVEFARPWTRGSLHLGVGRMWGATKRGLKQVLPASLIVWLQTILRGTARHRLL